jgi:hypothetical protein
MSLFSTAFIKNFSAALTYIFLEPPWRPGFLPQILKKIPFL